MNALSKLSIGLLFSGGYLSPAMAQELLESAEKPAKPQPLSTTVKPVCCPSPAALPCC